MVHRLVGFMNLAPCSLDAGHVLGLDESFPFNIVQRHFFVSASDFEEVRIAVTKLLVTIKYIDPDGCGLGVSSGPLA